MQVLASAICRVQIIETEHGLTVQLDKPEVFSCGVDFNKDIGASLRILAQHMNEKGLQDGNIR